MRDDFAILIMSHGRADNVVTVDTIKKCGYTGKWYIVIDNEDNQADQYIKNFGKEHIIVFDKVKAAGNGAMYFVVIRAWAGQSNKGVQTGHIFIVQNINGKPVCIEPQRQYYSIRQGDPEWLNNKESHWSTKNAHNYFWKMKEHYGIRYLRVDNNKLKTDDKTKEELKNRIIDFKKGEERAKYLDDRFNVKEVIQK